ncbi:MAG: PhzF family phenazine biosynthesis protein [Desulfobacterales bacterium]|nr:PhzF family phenazine biosynthesis protein [Desulfobacterales bacterium]
MPQKIKVHTLDVFAREEGGGNPAGVVLDAENLDDEQMRSIAKKVGFSETAFVVKSKSCDFKVRFFTPSSEVDLCGHATVAVYALLHGLKRLSPGEYTQEVKAGKLGVSVSPQGQVVMEQTLPHFGACHSPEEIAPLLRVSPETIDQPNLPIQEVSTGLTDILVPLSSPKELDAVRPDFKAMARFNQKTNTIGFHLFAQNDSGKIFCRNFAPLYDIEEEAATGSSSGALASYLWKQTPSKPSSFCFTQGVAMGRASIIEANLSTHQARITRVMVGGTARKSGQLTVNLSPF